jgi:hypothetical protein
MPGQDILKVEYTVLEQSIDLAITTAQGEHRMTLKSAVDIQNILHGSPGARLTPLQRMELMKVMHAWRTAAAQPKNLFQT